MTNCPNQETAESPEQNRLHARREFLQSMGRWSGAAIVAAVGVAWLGAAAKARAGAWVNRRGGGGGVVVGGGGGGWINGAGWVNRAGSWINGGGGGGGAWVNRRGAGGGAWVNRR